MLTMASNTEKNTRQSYQMQNKIHLKERLAFNDS